MHEFLNEIMKDNIALSIVVLLIAIGLDTFLGCIRAIKEKKWNSCFGINGLLRKVAMIGSVIFLYVFDCFFDINLIGFIPQAVTDVIGEIRIGVSSLFSILFSVYEATSILKNMVLCGLPVPKKFKDKLESILKEFTSELDGK